MIFPKLFLVEWCSEKGHCEEIRCKDEKCENNKQMSCLMDTDCKMRGCHEIEKSCKNNGELSTANITGLWPKFIFSYI